MRVLFRKVLSLSLSLLMFTSVAFIPTSANCGEKEMVTFEEACEKQWNEELGEIETVRYLFYMPDEWKNEYNDYYDGNDPSTYSVGIFWSNGSAKPDDCILATKPNMGYAVTEKIDGNNNIFAANVPADVNCISWNNSVWSGTDNNTPVYLAGMSTKDAIVNGYEPGMDPYGFYPNGLESMADMIYVCDPYNESETFTGKTVYKGEWFYYYGNGEYGYAPTKEEAGENVYRDGDFPTVSLLPPRSETIGIGGTVSITVNSSSTTAKSENEEIATVTKINDNNFIITGVSAGNTRILFEYHNPETQKTKKITYYVEVVEPGFYKTDITMNPGELHDNILTGMGENATISYSDKGIVNYDGYTVEALKCGKTTVTVTQGSKSLSFNVKVNHKIIKTNKAATYFSTGYKNRKICTACKKVFAKGTTLKKLKLKTPNAKITTSKKNLKIRYTKVKDATGFRVKYKIGKKSYTKSFNTKKTVTKTIKNLKKGSYKVYVQAFVKQGKKTAYSNWTRAKKVKIR